MKPLARLRCKAEDNVSLDVRETGWEVVDWIRVAEDRDCWRAFLNTVMNIRVA
jgi:hypothetical protein